uniref:Uncharacterized protein n=2 Tax=Caenorhabditis japonica TaxID=281687 RepID=A0A8R1IKH5_CAEJA
MVSPKRVKLNFTSGMRKRPDPPSEENREELYPPTALARDGSSPWFIGKPRRKIIDSENLAGGTPSFSLRILPESPDNNQEQIVIEEEEEDDEVIETPPQKKGIGTGTGNGKTRPFIGEKSSLRLEEFPGFLKSCEKEKEKEKGKEKPKQLPTKGFDFGSDEKVMRIREKVCDFVDPTGERRNDPNFVKQMHENTLKGIETATNPNFKRKRAPAKNRATLQSTIGTIYPNFVTASGQDPHKSKFQAPLERSASNSSTQSIGARKPLVPELPKRASGT